jgi:hypothetical protein
MSWGQQYDPRQGQHPGLDTSGAVPVAMHPGPMPLPSQYDGWSGAPMGYYPHPVPGTPPFGPHPGMVHVAPMYASGPMAIGGGSPMIGSPGFATSPRMGMGMGMGMGSGAATNRCQRGRECRHLRRGDCWFFHTEPEADEVRTCSSPSRDDPPRGPP